jgi:uncharacterized protein (TIGR03118 family)
VITGTRANRFQARLSLETLNDRCVPSANVLQTNLVSDLPGVAAVQDPNLVNPWGISGGGAGPFWISDNNAGVSTLYNVPGKNNTPVSINPLVVSIPTPVAASGGAPTGTVFNPSISAGAFKVSGLDKTGKATTAPAIFLFATEDGTIVGWNPGVDPTGKFAGPGGISAQAAIAVDNSGNNFTEPDPAKQTGAVYKGLTVATSATPIFDGVPASTTVLYAANFRTGQVEAYDANLKRITTPGIFNDPNLPAGYAPFNVQVLGDKVYVTYALQNKFKHDDVGGVGHGFVDVFNLNGTPGLPATPDNPNGTVRLVSHNHLDSPWGVAIAPSSFGALSGDLLVGNFKSGFIDVFDPTNGTFLDTLKDPDGEPIHIDRLWALKVSSSTTGGAADTVYFTAGLFNETHGLFGSLKPVAAGTPEGPAEQQMVTAFLDVFQLAVQTLNSDLSAGAPQAQIQQDEQAVDTALRNFIRAELAFIHDTFADQGRHHSHHGLDLDGDGDN